MRMRAIDVASEQNINPIRGELPVAKGQLRSNKEKKKPKQEKKPAVPATGFNRPLPVKRG